MKSLKDRHLLCLFSDDMRPEISGKTTVVGWYTNNIVNMPPEGSLLLPKLCITALLQTPVDRPFGEITIEVRLGKLVLQVAAVPSSAFESLGDASPAALLDEPAIGHQISISIEAGNFIIQEEGVLRVVALADGEEIMGNGLRFVRSAHPALAPNKLSNTAA